MKKFIVFSLCIIASFVTSARAQVKISAVPFLQIQPDARASGMGNTGVALANNSAAVFWNPAGLAYQKGNQINITHANWLPNFNVDLFYDYLVGRHHVDGVGTFGASVTYLNMGSQPRTTSRNHTGEGLGRFNSYQLAVDISYGYKFSDNWSIGTGMRFIHSSLFSGTIDGTDVTVSPASSVGFDLAALYKTNPFRSFGNNKASFHAGIDLSNLGPGLKYSGSDSTKEPLPTELRVGWAFKTGIGANSSITLTQDYSKLMVRRGEDVLQALYDSWGPFTRERQQGNTTLNTFQQLQVGTGLEYWYKHLFAVRTGYYFENPYNGNRRFITVGASIRYDFIGVDISHIFTLERYQPLANTTRFGLLLNF